MATACHEPVTVPVVETFENSATVVRAASWLHTARPIRTGLVIVIVWAVPNCVQVLPSGEIEPVKLLPLRSTLTQYGAAIAGAGLSSLVEAPLAVKRRWKLAPLPALVPPGVMGMKAWVEPVSTLWRIITPALAQTLVLTMLSTRATIEPSPVSCL